MLLIVIGWQISLPVETIQDSGLPLDAFADVIRRTIPAMLSGERI
jgi:hypothetical protein